jgi:hypothetical protein
MNETRIRSPPQESTLARTPAKQRTEYLALGHTVESPLQQQNRSDHCESHCMPIIDFVDIGQPASWDTASALGKRP